LSSVSALPDRSKSDPSRAEFRGTAEPWRECSWQGVHTAGVGLKLVMDVTLCTL